MVYEIKKDIAEGNIERGSVTALYVYKLSTKFLDTVVATSFGPPL